MAYVITEPCIGVKDASCLDVPPGHRTEHGEKLVAPRIDRRASCLS